VFCVLYAVSDEVHQLFVPGRGAQVTDVLIDNAGAFVGIGIYEVLG
jgi:VanZ family protein